MNFNSGKLNEDSESNIEINILCSNANCETNDILLIVKVKDQKKRFLANTGTFQKRLSE